MIRRWEHLESGRSYYRVGPHYIGEVWPSSDGAFFWQAGDGEATKVGTRALAMSCVEHAAGELA
jgi:hypothetical protein